MTVPAGKPGTRWPAVAGCYGVLFLLGVVEGTIGSFQYGRLLAGSVPFAAGAFCVAILLTCLFGGWGMRSVAGALMPAIGWILASFVLSMPVASGSVVITNTTPGKWYLYGGTVAVLVGVALSFGLSLRAPSR
jgi:hypothetical protein